MATINSVNNSVGVYSTGSTLTVTTGNCNVSSGNILLPTTTSSVGTISWSSGTRLMTYGTRNIFAGQAVANFTLTGTDNAVFAGPSSGGSGCLNAATTASRNSLITNGGGGRQFTTASDNALTGLALDSGTGGNPTGNIGCVSISGSNGLRGVGNYTIALGYTVAYTNNASNTSNISFNNLTTAGDTHKMYLGIDGTGTQKTNTCFMAGVLNSTVTGNAVLISSSPYQLGLAASSIRYKDNIQDMGETKLMSLRPVKFTYKKSVEGIHRGLIAEEVNEHIPEIVQRDDNGEIHTVNYHLLPSILLNEIQKQAFRLDKLIKRAEDLNGNH